MNACINFEFSDLMSDQLSAMFNRHDVNLGYNAGMASIEKQLACFLSKRSWIKLAILFGSQATGRVTADSDIDLAVLSGAPLTSDEKLELMQSIGAEFGRPVDIIDLYDAGEPMLGQVLKGTRLLGDNASYARLLTRHLLDAADFLPLQQRILKERHDAWTS